MIALYVKTHLKTGLKYFGKTSKINVHKYQGSGVYWKRHIRKHGYNVTTAIIGLFTDIEKCTTIAKEFSKNNNIVESLLWANLEEENGVNGKPVGAKGHTFSDEERKKISENSIANWKKPDFRSKVVASQIRRLSAISKEVLSERAKKAHLKIDEVAKGKKISIKWEEGVYSHLKEIHTAPKSDSHKKAISAALSGLKKSDVHKDTLTFNKLPDLVRLKYDNIGAFRLAVSNTISLGGNHKTLMAEYGMSRSWAYSALNKYKSV